MLMSDDEREAMVERNRRRTNALLALHDLPPIPRDMWRAACPTFAELCAIQPDGWERNT